MPLAISINKKNQKSALTGWEVIEITDYNALAMLLRRYAYSTSIFEKKRNIQNVIAFNNILIYDIDNDPKANLPTKSHNKPRIQGVS